MLCAVLWAAPALAEPPLQCAERSAVIAHLAGKYHEAPSATGVTHNGGLVEVLTSEAGTWTIIVTSPYGVSCMVSSGGGWKTFRPSPGPET